MATICNLCGKPDQMGEYVSFMTPPTPERPNGMKAVCARNHQCYTRLRACDGCKVRLLRNDPEAIEARNARGQVTAFYCDRNCADTSYAIRDND